jgi:homogentisate 1,2-dioxygenase
MEKFIYVGSISRDHIDPSVFCVLTAKSKQNGIPLADFLILGERWDVASDTFRPPVSILLVVCFSLNKYN